MSKSKQIDNYLITKGTLVSEEELVNHFPEIGWNYIHSVLKTRINDGRVLVKNGKFLWNGDSVVIDGKSQNYKAFTSNAMSYIAVYNTLAIDEKKVKRAVDYYCKEIASSTKWVLANSILYDLCDKYHFHNNPDEIVTKIWLIGRSYAAAIERNKKAKNNSGEYYYSTVSPVIIQHGKEIDSMIEKLNSIERITLDNIQTLLSAQGFLTRVFFSITDQEKRSLASKYLHFHSPQSVFIYDSVAHKTLGKLVKGNLQSSDFDGDSVDIEYAKYCIRALKLRDYIQAKYNLDLSMRQIDSLLLRTDV